MKLIWYFYFEMQKLKYTLIRNNKQYNEYCNTLEKLVFENSSDNTEEIELLNLLIEKWDSENNSLSELNPIELIKFLMTENQLKSKDLSQILSLSKGTVSKILNYHKGLSKETIRKLAEHFKVSQEAFNKPYKLVNEVNKHFKNASLMNTKKELIMA